MSKKKPPSLDKVVDIDIPPEGVFDFLLVKVSTKDGNSKYIIRGDCISNYHTDIHDKLLPKLTAQGFDCRVLGGGNMDHRGSKKEIMVYGFSGTYGEADHSLTCYVLRQKYRDYAITHRKYRFSLD